MYEDAKIDPPSNFRTALYSKIRKGAVIYHSARDEHDGRRRGGLLERTRDATSVRRTDENNAGNARFRSCDYFQKRTQREAMSKQYLNAFGVNQSIFTETAGNKRTASEDNAKRLSSSAEYVSESPAHPRSRKRVPRVASAETSINRVSRLHLLKKKMRKRVNSASATTRPRRTTPSSTASVEHAVSSSKIGRNIPTETECTRRSGCTCSQCTVAMDQDMSVIPVKETRPRPRRIRKRNVLRKSRRRQTSLSAGRSRKKKDSKWAAQSRQFREAMRAARQYEAEKRTGKVISRAPTATYEDPSFKACPHCGRTFNPTAHERHIKHCKNIRAKPRRLLKGGGRSAGSREARRYER